MDSDPMVQDFMIVKDFVLKTPNYEGRKMSLNGFRVEPVNLVDNVLRRDDTDFLSTGFLELERCLGGLDGGDLVVVASDTARLNSSFALTLIQKICVLGERPTMYFTPGCKADIVFFELLVNCGKLHSSPQRGYGEADVNNLNIALSRLGESHFFLNDSPDILLKDLSAALAGLVTSYGVRIALINHLDFIRTDERRGFISDETEEIMKTLKSLARTLDIPIVLFVMVAEMGGRLPLLSSIGPYGLVERFADVILILQDRNDERPCMVDVHVARSRGGLNEVIPLEYVATQYRFESSVKQ